MPKRKEPRGRPTKTFKKDQHMLGKPKYSRIEHDAYFTPEWCVDAFLDSYSENISGVIWEPFVGTGNIARVLQNCDHKVICTDLNDYGYPLTVPVDFRDDDIETFIRVLTKDFTNFSEEKPRWIITNPPYTKLQWYVERILFLCQKFEAGAALLLRNEFDSAKTRGDFFGNNPHYLGKIVLTTRPVWIEGEKQRASPRHNYSWFVWDYGSPATDKKEITYSYRGIKEKSIHVE